MGNEKTRRPKPPRPEEQIQPEGLARMIKKEKVPGDDRLKDIPPVPRNYAKFRGETRTGLPRSIFWAIGGLVVLFLAGFIVSFYLIKQKVKDDVSEQVGALQAGVQDLQNFDPQSAQQEFASLSGTSTPTLGGIAGVLGFLFKGGSGVVSSFSDMTGQLSSLSTELVSIEAGAFSFISTGQGVNLVSELGSLRDTLGMIDADSNVLAGAITSISPASSSLVSSSPDFGSSLNAGNVAAGFLPLKARIESAKDFLDVFVPWLSSGTPHHILVLLQNPSEMRPGGGFLGSYADVTLAGGNITDISVHDIADVDTAFHANIVPPKPLQLETPRFRPADANWFFDFPSSASETIRLFEQSGLYASTSFDGAIAVSPDVISDLLSLTGPITLHSTSTKSIASTTFTANNFLVQIQNIVQQGQATSATYPKAVLGQLSQALFQKLASSTDQQKQQLFSMVLDWLGKKDVMAYFTDPDFENFLLSYGAAGDVYQLSQNFNGDYLALVDTNIRGDKSDLYIAQNVNMVSSINADGTISDHLVIDRTHSGNKSPYWWYQTTNQDYLQIFVPDGSSLVDETGGLKKTITPPLNYARTGYSTDPMIASIESSTQQLFIYPAISTHEEDGKEVFATWSTVAEGKTTELTFDYGHRAFLPPTAGTSYQFIFEKQAGSVRSYDFEIDAPLGYVFAENGLASYEYTSDDPPGRLIINLTLQSL